MSDVYKNLNDIKKEQKYLNEYYCLKDSIDIENKKGINIAVDELYNKDKKGKEIISKKNKSLKILILCILVVLILSLIHI